MALEGYKQLKRVLSSTQKGMDSKQGFSSQTTLNSISKPFKAAQKGFMSYHNFLQDTGNKMRQANAKLEKNYRTMGNRFNSFVQSNVSKAKEDHDHNNLMKKLIKQKRN